MHGHVHAQVGLIEWVGGSTTLIVHAQHTGGTLTRMHGHVHAQVGLIEWVGGTTTLKGLIEDEVRHRDGAHRRGRHPADEDSSIKRWQAAYGALYPKNDSYLPRASAVTTENTEPLTRTP